MRNGSKIVRNGWSLIAPARPPPLRPGLLSPALHNSRSLMDAGRGTTLSPTWAWSLSGRLFGRPKLPWPSADTAGWPPRDGIDGGAGPRVGHDHHFDGVPGRRLGQPPLGGGRRGRFTLVCHRR